MMPIVNWQILSALLNDLFINLSGHYYGSGIARVYNTLHENIGFIGVAKSVCVSDGSCCLAAPSRGQD